MSTEPAYQLSEEVEPLDARDVREQLQLNRMAVDHAESATLAQATHPARWDRSGLLQRLVRREPG